MNPLFQSFFLAGFECSTQRYEDGRRLDLLESTGHDRFACEDYHAVQRHGIHAVRDGVRWHRIERASGQYDWSSFLPMLHASRHAGVQAIWDLCHYGVPDHIDIWSHHFIDHFARYCRRLARLVREETEEAPCYCPINEISFWAWAGGDMAVFYPSATRRGMELKHQLVRASLAAVDAIRDVDARARIVHVDPVIHVLPTTPRNRPEAEHARNAQYEAWDMLEAESGQLDIVGVNYYSDNQWRLRGATIPRGDPFYRPFRDILRETYERFKRPLFIAETGAEGEQRVPWLRYVCDEVHAARDAGIPVGGICLYPVTDYAGWADQRHCESGLLGLPDAEGRRSVHQGLAGELKHQQERFSAVDMPLARLLRP